MLSDILELLAATPTKIMDEAEKELQRIGYKVTRDPDGLFTFAVPPKQLLSIVPMLVSHVDVVGEMPPDITDIIQNESGNKITLDPKSKAKVLGADDRAGIYAVFRIVKALHNKLPFVVLTDGEEQGGLGAQALVVSGLLDNYVEQISCFIELDRQGSGEFVSYDNSGYPNNDFADILCDQGFTSAYGSYSDVADFTAYTSISNVNLSVGYRNQHTKKETLFMDDLELTITRVKQMWQAYPDLFEKVFEQESATQGCTKGMFDDQVYNAMLEEIYKLVDLAEVSTDVSETVTHFVDNMAPALVDELVDNFEEVVDELNYTSFGQEGEIVATLMDMFAPCYVGGNREIDANCSA